MNMMADGGLNSVTLLQRRIASCIGVGLVMVTFVMAGCDKSPDAPKAIAAAPRPAAAETRAVEEVRGNGVVRGHVKFEGTPPVMATIANEPCHDGATPMKEETVVVGKDGGLKNAFVSIEGLPEVDGAALSPALLDQVNCQYVPHMVGVCVGQTLQIHSSDPTLHNVHYTPDLNPPQNIGMTAAGSEKAVTFKAAEMIRVKCDVHPWMTAYIGVFDNSFFAVTKDDGSFQINGLPPGNYKLNVWHERYGKLQQDVTVSDAAPADVQVVYKAP